LRGATSLDTFKTTISGRLASLAATHDLIARAENQPATLSELIHSELAPYGSATMLRWYTSGPDVRFSAKQALATGMMIHELATNAAKYGALSAPEGLVNVAWKVTGVAGARTLNLVWTESGGPTVAAPARRGFGLRLITQAIAEELHGKVQVAFHPDGLRCDVDMPLTDAALA
jgi:two-component sensor histidine kinase